jgi:hypothetical protein
MINSDRYYSIVLANRTEEFGFLSSFIRYEIAICKGEFYRILKNAASFFDKTEYANEYRLKEKHYFKIAYATHKAYCLFGDNLLTPSVNRPREDILYKLWKESTENSNDKINKLLQDTKYELIDTNETLDYRNKEKNDFKGICFAQTLMFLKDTFGKNPSINELKILSEKHMDGSNKKAVRINNIQNIKNLENKNVKPLTLDVKNKLKSISIDLNLFNKEHVFDSEKLPLEDRELKIEEDKGRANVFNQSMIDDLMKKIQNIPWLNMDVDINCSCVLELLGLKTTKNNKNFNTNNLNAIQDHLVQLPIGRYLLETSATNNGTELDLEAVGHAIAYIKLEEGAFLRDPNLGLVKIPKGKDAEYIKICLDHIKHDTVFFSTVTELTG